MIQLKRSAYLQQQKLLEPTSPPHCASPPISNLQQQKLLEPTSLQVLGEGCAIYNSRNYQSLLATTLVFPNCQISTIVEIIRAYQPSDTGNIVVRLSTIVEIIRAYQPIDDVTQDGSIYNSRNYQSLLAFPFFKRLSSTSTIVEIIRTYQPVAAPL